MRRWTQDCILSNMDWKPGGISDDVEDRRDDGGGGGGGFSGMGFGAPHIGIGGILLLLVLSLVFHRNLFTMFLGGSGTDAPPAVPVHSHKPALPPLRTVC